MLDAGWNEVEIPSLAGINKGFQVSGVRSAFLKPVGDPVLREAEAGNPATAGEREGIEPLNL